MIFWYILHLQIHALIMNVRLSSGMKGMNYRLRFPLFLYSKACLKRPLKNRQNKINVLKTNGILMKVESIAECSLGAFCNTFDLH